MTDANTQYEFRIPSETQDLRMVLSHSGTAWRYSMTPGVVAGGGGAQVSAGDVVEVGGPLDPGTLYLACGAQGKTVVITYTRPARCG